RFYRSTGLSFFPYTTLFRSELMAKVLNAHGASHPELKRISELVQELDYELLSHLAKEEKVLFPYIKQLVLGETSTQFSTVETPIDRKSTRLNSSHVKISYAV